MRGKARNEAARSGVAHRAFEGEGRIILFDCLRLFRRKEGKAPRGDAARSSVANRAFEGEGRIIFGDFLQLFSDLLGLFRGDLPPWFSPNSAQGSPLTRFPPN